MPHDIGMGPICRNNNSKQASQVPAKFGVCDCSWEYAQSMWVYNNGSATSTRSHMAATAYINRIATAVPPNDVHKQFLQFAEALFRKDSGTLSAFRRMAER